MMLTVSMTVSHLYQNLENIKSVKSLKIIAINAQSHFVDAPFPPGLGVEITCVHMGES